MSIVETVVDYNVKRKKFLASKIVKLMNGNIKNKKISILGLSFKPGTDDMRESPSLDVIPALIKLGANIFAFDPVAKKEARKLMNNVNYSKNLEDCIKESHCIVLLTEWSEFRSLSSKILSRLMKGNCIIDFRNALDPNNFKDNRFKLYQIGRGKI